MKDPWLRALRLISRQHGHISRSQLLALGVSPSRIQRLLASGQLLRVHAGVYRLNGAATSIQGKTMAACLATGGWASHQSAAWLWGLCSTPPAQPTVTVAAPSTTTRRGVTVHRTALPELRNPAKLAGIPCTTPARTLVDLATVATDAQLDEAIDQAVARRLVRLDVLITQLTARGGPARPGEARLRAALTRLSYLGAPAPSVLESMVLRLLAGAGVRPRSCERHVEVDGFHHRIDIELGDLLGIEVDGYTFHATPQARERDHHRRNRLAAAGWRILVFTWKDVCEDGERVVREVIEFLNRHGRPAESHR